MNNTTNINTLTYQLITGNAQLTEAQHDAFLSENRQLYAALLRLPNLSPETAMSIIQRLLAVTDISGQAIPKAQRLQEDKLIVEILPHLPVASVLQGFLKLVELRINNQRTSGWIRAYIFGSPQLESWAVNHRRDLRKLIRHALGNPVTLTCLHKFKSTPTDKKLNKTSAYLKRYILRYGKNTALIREVFLFLFGKLSQSQSQFTLLNAYLTAGQNIEAGKGLPLKVLRGIAATYHPKISKRTLIRLASREKIKRQVTEETEASDESLIGKIRRYYRSDKNTDLTPSIKEIKTAIKKEAAHLTHWDANIYFILDASASMLGFGNRQYNNMAIAMALLKVFQQRTKKTQTTWIGATPSKDEEFPQPIGATSIAPALIQAVKHKPDVIILISDGYENVEQGDTATVLTGLTQLGINIPIFHIMPAFTERDKIENRQPLPGCPILLETGQRGFLSTWLRIRAHLQPETISDQLSVISY